MGSPPPKPTKKVKFEESKSSGKVDMTGWVVPAGCEPDSKTCRGCLKRGHIWANCPDRVTTEKALVGQDEDDWESEDEGTFTISATKKRDRETALFLSEEILLDNQASQCIFHNEGLLHGVVGRDPYTMCGIDGSQSGLQVDRTGRISGFRKIGATVGLAAEASANILAQARLVDAGYGVRYDSVLDQYEVDTDSNPMIFARRTRGHGRRSPHYTHVIERAFVETVTGNKSRFTRREGAAAEAGKELLSKFAHGSWKGVTDQVERGIKNLTIAGADMRRAKTIWKLTEASMKGKTRITIMLDDDVIKTFRDRAEERGIGYQTAINEALRAAAGAEDVPVTVKILREVLHKELRSR
jgi:uncharacterized protein (DUF4415 family)